MAGAGGAVLEPAPSGVAAGTALAERGRRLQVRHDVCHGRPVLALQLGAVHRCVDHQLGLVLRRLQGARVQHLAARR